MIVLTVTEFARNLKNALNRVEVAREEIVLVRNKRRIGRIVPGEQRGACPSAGQAGPCPALGRVLRSKSSALARGLVEGITARVNGSRLRASRSARSREGGAR